MVSEVIFYRADRCRFELLAFFKYTPLYLFAQRLRTIHK